MIKIDGRSKTIYYDDNSFFYNPDQEKGLTVNELYEELLKETREKDSKPFFFSAVHNHLSLREGWVLEDRIESDIKNGMLTIGNEIICAGKLIIGDQK